MLSPPARSMTSSSPRRHHSQINRARAVVPCATAEEPPARSQQRRTPPRCFSSPLFGALLLLRRLRHSGRPEAFLSAPTLGTRRCLQGGGTLTQTVPPSPSRRAAQPLSSPTLLPAEGAHKEVVRIVPDHSLQTLVVDCDIPDGDSAQRRSASQPESTKPRRQHPGSMGGARRGAGGRTARR